MSDGVPKSRVTLTYDTRQPEGREKPRELPLRLLVMGDVGGNKKDLPLESRRVRQLNGRNLGEVMKGLKIQVADVSLGDRKVAVLIDSVQSFAPDDVLRSLTGQKRDHAVDPALKNAWGASASAETLWPGDAALTKTWAQRELVVGFQKSYQNSKTLRTALKAFSTEPGKDDAAKRAKAIKDMKDQIAAKIKANASGTTGTGATGTTGSGATGATGTTGTTGSGATGTTGRGGTT